MIHATLCYIRNNGRTLFLHRTSGTEDIHNDKYVAPGGKMNSGETGITCVVRECEEETGLTIVNPKIKILATFYNKGRLLGGKESPEDWFVEFYEATEFTGNLKAERSSLTPSWVEDSKMAYLPMHEGDMKLGELMKQEGIYEVLIQYDKEKLIKFETKKIS